jgi:hypothetical protein
MTVLKCLLHPDDFSTYISINLYWLIFVLWKKGNLKSDTVASLEQYVHKDPRLPVLLDR